MRLSRFAADIFHDVDLAALRPAVRGDVIAQHPESWPHSLPCRNFDKRFKSAVRLIEKSLRLQSGGSVVALDAVRSRERFFLRGDHESAAFYLCINGAICVSLQLL